MGLISIASRKIRGEMIICTNARANIMPTPTTSVHQGRPELKVQLGIGRAISSSHEPAEQADRCKSRIVGVWPHDCGCAFLPSFRVSSCGFSGCFYSYRTDPCHGHSH